MLVLRDLYVDASLQIIPKVQQLHPALVARGTNRAKCAI